MPPHPATPLLSHCCGCCADKAETLNTHAISSFLCAMAETKRPLKSNLSKVYHSRVITVEPIVFLFALGKLFYMPTVEQYYYHYYGSKILSDTPFDPPSGSYCINSSLIDEYTGSQNSYKQDETQSNNLVIYTSLAGTFPGVLVALIMGPVTDRYGRKLGILLPSIGSFILGLSSMYIIYFNINPLYLILANLFLGVTGDVTTLIAACFAYIADTSSMRWRSFRIAAVEGILALGKLSGNLIGGYWLRGVNCNFFPLMIFYTATTVAMILYTVCMPESYTREKRKKLMNKGVRGFLQKYVKGLKLYFGEVSFSMYVLYVVTGALFVAVLSIQGSLVLSVYFLKAVPFEFDPVQISYYQALKSATQGIFCLLFFLFVFCNVKDSVLLLLGFIVSGLCNVLTGFADTNWELYSRKDNYFPKEKNYTKSV